MLVLPEVASKHHGEAPAVRCGKRIGAGSRAEPAALLIGEAIDVPAAALAGGKSPQLWPSLTGGGRGSGGGGEIVCPVVQAETSGQSPSVVWPRLELALGIDPGRRSASARGDAELLIAGQIEPGNKKPPCPRYANRLREQSSRRAR